MFGNIDKNVAMFVNIDKNISMFGNIDKTYLCLEKLIDIYV